MAEQKTPIEFTVFLHQGQNPTAVPPVALADAGGNRVTVRNLLDLPIEVTHNGRLIVADDPFTVPAKASGPPPEVTYRVNPTHDVPGTVVTLKMHSVNNTVRTPLSAISAAGDPQIIIF